MECTSRDAPSSPRETGHFVARKRTTTSLLLPPTKRYATNTSTSDSDADRAGLVLRTKKNQKLNQPLVGTLSNDNNDASPRTIIAEGVRTFLQNDDKTRGANPMEAQNAVHAVTTASLSAKKNQERPEKEISTNLGIRHIEKALETTNHLLRTGQLFNPPARKVRSDCVSDAAKICVESFCHDDAYSRMDTSIHAQMFDVKKDGKGKPEKHIARFWHVEGLRRRHQQLLHSPHFRQFQTDYPGRSISKTALNKWQCICTQNAFRVEELPINGRYSIAGKTSNRIEYGTYERHKRLLDEDFDFEP